MAKLYAVSTPAQIGTAVETLLDSYHKYPTADRERMLRDLFNDILDLHFGGIPRPMQYLMVREDSHNVG